MNRLRCKFESLEYTCAAGSGAIETAETLKKIYLFRKSVYFHLCTLTIKTEDLCSCKIKQTNRMRCHPFFFFFVNLWSAHTSVLNPLILISLFKSDIFRIAYLKK